MEVASRERAIAISSTFTQIEARMTNCSKAASTAKEISAIKALMVDREKTPPPPQRSNQTRISGASGDINEFVNDALDGIIARIRNGAHSVSSKATHLGSDVFKKISDEVEQCPFTMLAIAAGVGLTLGLARR